MKNIRIFLVIPVLLLLAACAGKKGDAPSLRGNLIGAPAVLSTVTAQQVDALTAGYGLQALTPAATCDVQVVQINYQTPGVQPGEMSNASAALLIPTGASLSGPLPLIVYSRATTLDKAHFTADITAPETRLLMIFFASQGYAVVASDYLGYARSEYPYHPYIHADSEASAVIDAVRGARQAAPGLGLDLSGKLLLTGYSQGGHASMATQRAMERDNPGEFQVVAAAHLAGPYCVSVGMVDGVAHAMIGVQTFIPFEITAYQKIYGNVYGKASDVFQAPYDSYIESLLPTLDLASLPTLLPGGTPLEARDALFQPSFLADLATNPANGAFLAARKQDLLLGWCPRAPVLLCGGSGDPTVDFSIARAAYENFKSQGATVTLTDVDPLIRAKYATVLANAPATYTSAYHGQFESPFCCQAAKAFFDGFRAPQN